ncbi:hypothetical protein XM38_027240 [Halomicronema hongdechloris C2206]|uniref:Sucrase ferredoxin n=1 Tax=Halomicronema hongdechloris C2206 TaxID=1641165 RepID=A0A1Z3HNA7_9CYAN|nr:sucrase ferredoxin [Halomicronema hongdechloris]ASC71770.1 hypothetical protein XM38_027240 [Halomicronema hongdechloris C2206]
MTKAEILTNFCYCCEVSKANGEDPIGSAGNYDAFLFIEVPEPWPIEFWQAQPQFQPIADLATQLKKEQGLSLRAMAIAPDCQYSQPNYTRILYYRRPSEEGFVQFEKQEFVVPDEQVVTVVLALLQQPDLLPQFESSRQETEDIREMMLCTHGSYDVACGRFGYPLYRQLRSEHAANSGGKLRVWRCTHLGPHNFAPTLVDFPEGRYWGHLELEVLDLLVYRRGPVADLYDYYQGWAGLSQVEQIAEREMWMQEGWNWFHYAKVSQVLAMDESDEYYPDWAEVRIDFNSHEGRVSGTYEARVEVSGTVKTMWSSGKDKPLWEVKQYRVSRLNKVV